jgi:hypothetical protein
VRICYTGAGKISDGVLKIGMMEDMASIYSDITGVGAVTAAKMAVEDFGGKVAGKPIEVVAADHQNKPDIASATAREWFEVQHVDALMDVAASATALAAIEVAKAKNKIVVLNGPGATRITNEACTPISIHYTYDNYALSHGTGAATIKAGYDSWFFITADYAFGHDLEQVTADVVRRAAGVCSAACAFPSIPWISHRRCCRRNPRKPRWWGSPMPAPTPPMPSSRRPSSGLCAVAKSSRDCSSSSTTSTRSAWRRRKACCSPMRSTGIAMRKRGRGRGAISSA